MATIRSQGRTLEFGPGHPTARIGERINPTGKTKIQNLILQRDLGWLDHLVREQEEAGANVLGINLGIPGVDEAELLVRAVERVSEISRLPLYLDSSIKSALMSAVEAYPHTPLVGSATGEEKSYKPLMEFLEDRAIPLVVMLNDEKGVSRKAVDRVRVAEKVLDYGAKIGFEPQNLVFDCIAMTVAADPSAALETLECIRTVSQDLGCATIIGLSNVSFGLPERRIFNRAFVSMAVLCGLSAAIFNPNSMEMTETILAADVLAGRDDYAINYLEFYRRKARAPVGE